MYKLSVILITVLYMSLVADWRQYPNGILLQTTVEHELLPQIDTVNAIHWHKSGDKFYIITTDSMELWVDNVQLIKGGSK